MTDQKPLQLLSMISTALEYFRSIKLVVPDPLYNSKLVAGPTFQDIGRYQYHEFCLLCKVGVVESNTFHWFLSENQKNLVA